MIFVAGFILRQKMTNDLCAHEYLTNVFTFQFTFFT